MKYGFLFLLFSLLCLAGIVFAQADGIPDNCEYTGASYYRAEIFPRYEPQNRRLVLVSWTTGADVLTLATDLDNTLIRGWSIDCRYLAVATGTNADWRTVVFDTLSAEKMGEWVGAHEIPHPLTWGFDNYLVLESRNGAVLWHLPSFQQIPLAAAWNDSTNRNFSRLRWDSENRQLIANLAVGGRVVYDLTTGQIVPQVAENTDSISGEGPQIIIGGAAYDCVPYYQYGYRQWFGQQGPVAGGIFLRHEPEGGNIYLALYEGRQQGEILVMLESNHPARSLNLRGYSADCRYVAASLGRRGENASDTYVWDVSTGLRVGIIPDAQVIMHPVFWHPNLPYLLVETDAGAILWHLPSNNQMQLNTSAVVPITGYSRINNFYQYAWTDSQVLLRLVESENSVTVFNLSDGQIAANYQADGIIKANFVLSSDTSHILLCCTAEKSLSIWNRSTGSQTWLHLANPQTELSYAAFSPDNRYLAYNSSEGLLVWDLQNLSPNALPNYHYADLILRRFNFVDSVTILAGDVRIDLRQGIVSPEYNLPTNSIAQESGSSNYYGGSRCNSSRRQFSPDCRWLVVSEPFIEPSDAVYDDAPVDDIYRDQLSTYLVIKDANTGQELRRFPNPYRYGHGWQIVWSPNSDRAFIRTTEGYYLYQPDDDIATLLVYAPNRSDRGIDTNFFVYWDYQRGQILVSGWQHVFAFDMQTGQERFRFSSQNNCPFHGCNFSVRNNQQLVINSPTVIAIWDLDTLESRFVQQDYRSRGLIYINSEMSYLLRVQVGVLQVWDLENLPSDFWERDPIYTYPIPRGNIRFIDESTIEIDTGETVYQMNILTGEISNIP